MFILAALPVNNLLIEKIKFVIEAICIEYKSTYEIAHNNGYGNGYSNILKNQIANADIVIVDFSGCDHFVLKVAGYSAGLGKQVIHFCEIGEPVKLDLKSSLPQLDLPFKIYNGDINIFKQELENVFSSFKQV